MNITVNGIDIFYERANAGAGTAAPVLILHGWGARAETMRVIFDNLSRRGIDVVCPDIPPFGLSAPPPNTFDIFGYADLILEFINALGIKKPVIIGHSFGGRIAIILSAKYAAASKLILTDSAGLKPKKKLKTRLKILKFKLFKLLKIKQKNCGSSDYLALSEDMRAVFKRVVNGHLDKLVSKITAPTLLIWGGKDFETPVYVAKRLEKKIKNSGLVLFESCGHYPFLEKPNEFNVVVDEFVRIN